VPLWAVWRVRRWHRTIIRTITIVLTIIIEDVTITADIIETDVITTQDDVIAADIIIATAIVTITVVATAPSRDVTGIILLVPITNVTAIGTNVTVKLSAPLGYAPTYEKNRSFQTHRG
jgi:hypothetical protein